MTAAPWSPEAGVRFAYGLLELLADDGVTAHPLPGSLRVEVGGSTVTGPTAVIVWAERGPNDHVCHHRHLVPPSELGRILMVTADRIPTSLRGNVMATR